MAVVVNTVKIVSFGSNGIEVTVLPGVAIPGSTPAFLIAGSDGTNARYIKTATDGTVRVDPTGTTTQPISAASLPLPSNAATESSLAAQSLVDNTAYGDGVSRVVPAGFVLDEVAGTALTENDAAAARIDSKRAQIYVIEDETTRGRRLTITASNAAKVDGSAVTQPISAASLPLPTGAAQEHTTAVSPHSIRLSDGSAFYDATKTGQLPAALTGSGNLKVSVSEFTASIPTGSNTIGKVDQGAAAALSSAWPIKLTDGTNTHPTADVAARAAFTKITDGTNTMPTMDVIARSGFVQISDGTNGPAAIKAASTAPAAGDKAQVVVISPNQQSIPVTTAPSGAVPGASFGDIALSSIISNQAVRRTTYTEQASNAQRSFVSASASDASAGTGARTVKITYYTATWTGPFTETVTMNGTTPVNTVAVDICYVEKIEVMTVGSTGANVGAISLKAATAGGGATIWTIAATDNRTYGAHHYVPTGKTCSITSLSVTINGGSGIFFMKSISLNTSNAAEIQISDYVRAATQAATGTRPYGTPIQVTGPARITAYVNTEVNTSLTYRAAFDFYDQ